MTAAIIDLGSNSLRLGIYKNKNGIQLVESARYTTRLGEGLAATEHLQQNAMDRTVEAFFAAKEIIKKYPDCKVKCVATEAMRRAKNGKDFCNRVLAETGFAIEIIDGEQEAEYGLFAASLSAKTESFYMLDTGGGSFEVVLCEQNQLKGHISLPYGAVVLTETYQPDQTGTTQMDNFIAKQVQGISFVQPNGYPIVLLGGANRMLGKMASLQNDQYPADGYQISVSQATQLINTIIATPKDQRKNLKGMEANRADIIAAGFAPLKALLAQTNAKNLILSGNSIREAIAYQLLK